MEDPAPMDARSKRREATRRQLEQQLKERQARAARRKRATLIASVVGTVVVVALIVVLVVVLAGGSDSSTKTASSKSPSATTSTSASSAASSAVAAAPTPTAACTKPGKGDKVTYDGLTITGSTNLKKSPVVTGKATGGALSTVQCDDLVVGTGKAATTKLKATVEYIGLVLKTGKVFQTSWTSSTASFGLTTSDVIAGFSQGIAGAGKIAPMRVGGRRLILMPASTAYGASPPSGSNIPANADLAFIVDLRSLA